MKIDCISIRVKDFPKAISRFRKLLGISKDDMMVIKNMEAGGERENCGLLKVADYYLEIISPCDSSSRLGKVIEKRGEGIHHINLVTDDLPGEISRLKNQGFRFSFVEPLIDMFGCQYAFVHPESTHGALICLGEAWERVGKDGIRPVRSKAERT